MRYGICLQQGNFLFHKHKQMKKIFFVISLIGASIASKAQPGQQGPLKNENDSLSYCIGLSIGKSLAESDLQDVDVAKIAQGMSDILKNNPTMSLQEAEMYIQKVMVAKQEAKSADYIKMQQAFLEQNKIKEGVKTTSSGLQYKVISEGNGAKPVATDMVTVHYTGTLIDGTVFDSSVQRGEPATFGLNQVIPGWTEGVQLMSVGSKYQFFIPQELGYGQGGMGEIKPYSTLIFEVELISIEKR